MSRLIFSRLSNIEPEKTETFDRLFLTIDIDWAHDDVINATIDIIEKADVEATWFITHHCKVLSRLRENPKFELGIHPNFNFLLDGDNRNGGNLREVLERLLAIVPDAKCLRSHSLLSSTKLLQLMPEYGLTHESNMFIPSTSCEARGKLTPFRIWNGVVRVPHLFEDDLFLLTPRDSEVLVHTWIENCARRDGIRVFDFHPIHIFLNTENFERYDFTRALHQAPSSLVKHSHRGLGSRSALETLLRLS